LASRKALLIGIERYGAGFSPLPAARYDVERLGKALQGAGYETEICPDAVTESAAHLDTFIRQFCEQGGPEDVRLIYFSGHGLRADGKDWIVPAGISLSEAAETATRRVPTDLGSRVAISQTGLVLFIIDACRNRIEQVDSGATAIPQEPRFIRYFGCEFGEVCCVTRDAAGTPASVFTLALTETLEQGECLSLDALQTEVARRQRAILAADAKLSGVNQTAILNLGELSDVKVAILKRSIFDLPGATALDSVWPSFDPTRLHCLVVLSEDSLTQDEWGLKELVSEALAGTTGLRIWKAFRDARNGQKLADGRQHLLPEALNGDSVAFSAFSVVDALASRDSLNRAVRAVAEADLVVFDVTGFEPGAMLLAGVRSASRRGLSICSHGRGWKEGYPFPVPLPFNLQDLNYNSHTMSDVWVGTNPVVERFVQRIETGFDLLAHQPFYLDLPAFDSLRQLGSNYAAASLIGVERQVLVLCSYDKGFFDNWRFVVAALRKALSDRGIRETSIERIIDHASPQLVQQSLYEKLRRTAACVIDWSQYSASVFLEFGARLAATEWGAVHIIDERHLPGAKGVPTLVQIARLQHLFNPVVCRYRNDNRTAFEQVAVALARGRADAATLGEIGYNPIHRTLLEVVAAVQPALPSVAVELTHRADALHHPDQGKVGAPQILFAGSRAIKQDAERTAAELRLAGWLYLEYRVGAAACRASTELATLYWELGLAAIEALYTAGDDTSLSLATTIEDRLEKEAIRPSDALAIARLARKKGEALARAGRQEADVFAAYDWGVRSIEQALAAIADERAALEALPSLLPLSPQAALLDQLVESFGVRGGLRQRQGRLLEALESYAAGAALEDKFQLPSTYNRLNWLKQTLLTKDNVSLDELTPQIETFSNVINDSLNRSQELSATAWPWADLGDCLALLGRTDESARAYSQFIAKAEIKSPDRALDMLRQIGTRLEERHDPGAQRVQAAIAALHGRLSLTA
jgi:tetratricopeptide (TPR) repeat protein